MDLSRLYQEKKYQWGEIQEIFDFNTNRGINICKSDIGEIQAIVLIAKYKAGCYLNYWKNNIFFFNGIGQVGNQSIDYYYNRVLRNSIENQYPVYLFESFLSDEYIYRGKLELISEPYVTSYFDKYDETRNILVYPLKPLDFDEPKHNYDKLLFVHRIIEKDLPLDKLLINDTVQIELFEEVPHFLFEGFKQDFTINDFEVIDFTTNSNISEGIKEGSFVRFKSVLKEDEIPLTSLKSAEKEKAVKELTIKAEMARSKIVYKEIAKDNSFKDDDEEMLITEPDIIKSYHINVDNGNCTIIFIKKSDDYKIWFVDCANRQRAKSTDRWYRIIDCLQHIKDSYDLASLEIEKLFITHNHYDHISGFKLLHNNGLLKNEAEIYCNVDFIMRHTFFVEILEYLDSTTSTYKVISPIVSNSNQYSKILHPVTPILNHMVEKINDSSIVFKFKFKEKSMIFPGDIEKEGWNTFASPCGELNDTDYFCASHHASYTGHIRKCIHTSADTEISNCLPLDSKVIIMGKDNAYNGIYSQSVINDFNGKGISLLYSQKPAACTSRCPKPCTLKCNDYLEIDWDTGIYNTV